MKSLSVVIPAYKSQDSLPDLIDALSRFLPYVTSDFEVIVVDDGSPDNTGSVVEKLATGDRPWLKPIRLMRNFGQHNALLCGIRHAVGEITVTMDDDLQQNPENISQLLAQIEAGYDVVYGYPQNLKQSLLRNFASEITKAVLQKAMGAATARHIGPFRAFRTDLREAFANYGSPFVNIDVLLSWATTRFTYVLVPYSTRKYGESSYTLPKLITHAVNMLTGFSILPLQLATIYGFICILFGLLALAYVFARFFLEGGSVAGFPFLASIIIIFSGAQLLTLGIIGEYLARMYVRMSDRPSYIVKRHDRTDQQSNVPASSRLVDFDPLTVETPRKVETLRNVDAVQNSIQ